MFPEDPCRPSRNPGRKASDAKSIRRVFPGGLPANPPRRTQRGADQDDPRVHRQVLGARVARRAPARHDLGDLGSRGDRIAGKEIQAERDPVANRDGQPDDEGRPPPQEYSDKDNDREDGDEEAGNEIVDLVIRRLAVVPNDLVIDFSGYINEGSILWNSAVLRKDALSKDRGHTW